MTPDGRLTALEKLLDMAPSGAATTPEERSFRVILDGTAGRGDFEQYFGPALPVIRARVVMCSSYFRHARESGVDTWAWWPSDVAAKIAAVPLGESPDLGLPEHLLRLVSIRVPPAGSTRPLRPPQRQVAWSIWAGACLAITALGSPDGRPLRALMAEGHFGDADTVVRTAGLPVPSWAEMARRCPLRQR